MPRTAMLGLGGKRQVSAVEGRFGAPKDVADPLWENGGQPRMD